MVEISENMQADYTVGNDFTIHALRRLLTYPARPAKPGFPRGNGPYSERRQRIEVWMTLVKSLFWRWLK